MAADGFPNISTFFFWIMLLIIWFAISIKRVPPGHVVVVFRMKRLYGVRGSGLAYGGLRGFARMIPIDLTKFFTRNPEFIERDRFQRARLQNAIMQFLNSKLMKRKGRRVKAYDIFMALRGKDVEWPSRELFEFLERKLIRKPSESVTASA